MENLNRELLSFIEQCPTAWQAAAKVAETLEQAGFCRLREEDDWTLRAPGKYFVVRNGSAVIALNLPAQVDGFLMMAAHDDAPGFRVKADPENKALGLYTRLSVENYGGMLCSTWMDRPLSLAGRVAVRENGGVAFRLVNIERDLLLIPNLAIHMDRSANDGKKFNTNEDMLPLLGGAELSGGLNALLARELGVKEEDNVSHELNLYPRTPGTVWGADNEYVSSPRLDDLQCVFGCLHGFLDADASESLTALCVFDNEEVGSSTKQGAASTFLFDTLTRIAEAKGRTLSELLPASLILSCDNGHARHPNHPELSDGDNSPCMNGGVVIKHNANQRYTTDALSEALFAEICARADVPVQHFANRSDIAGGGTLGSISNTRVSLKTVDIGLAQLAMHSAVETGGVKDTAYMIRACKAFFEAALTLEDNTIELL